MKPIIRQSLLLILGVAFSHRVLSQAPSITYSPSTSNLTVGVSFTLSPANTGGTVPATIYGQVTTVAGSIWGTGGYTNATGTAALFNRPEAVVGLSGNLYVADHDNNAVRLITPAGVVSTFAGSATGVSGNTDGTGTSALFNGPDGLAFDASGNLFVADKGNNAIRKVTSGGIVTTFYHSTGTFGPAGLCFDSAGNLIVAAQSASQVWKITPAGVATTIAGNWAAYANGTGTSALFQILSDVKIDASGNIIVADYLNNAIRKITPAGVVTTLAGSTVSNNTGAFLDGTGTAARFNNPTATAIAGGGIIYVADFENNDIRRIMPDGTVTLVAGSPTQAQGTADGTGTAAQFSGPDNLYIDGTGTGYISEYGNRVKKIILTGYTISGTLPAGLTFNVTTGVISGTPTSAITAQTDTITAYNATGYSTTTVTLSATAIVAPVISYGSSATLTSGTAFSLSPTNTGGAIPATAYGQVTTIAGSRFGSSGYVNGIGTAARFKTPQRIVGDGAGNLYVADYGNNAIRKVTSAGVVTTFAGSATGVSGNADGTGTAALFSGPEGLVFDPSGNLFVADNGNNSIRKITPAGVVTTFYTAPGSFGPAGMCFDNSGNLIVAAKHVSQIWKITPAGVATTIAGNTYGYTNGTGTAALFENPADVQVDPSGNIFVADYLNNAIRKITPAGVVTTYAGSTVSGNTGGYVNGSSTAARFNNPTGVAFVPGGILYVEDFVNNDIRKIMPDGTVTLVAGSPTQVVGTVDGTGTAATFSNPIDLYIDGTGTGYDLDMGTSVRKILLTGYTISGALPAGLTFDPATGIISGTPTGTITTQTDTITAYNAGGYSIAMVTFAPPAVPPTISYSGSQAFTVGTPIAPLTPIVTGGPVPYTGYTTTFAGSGASGTTNGVGTTATFALPDGLTVDSKGNVYVTDISNSSDIRKITPSAVVSTLAGSATSGFVNGTGSDARFSHPDDLSTDTAGNVYVADQWNHAIRKITPAGVVTTLAGGTPGSADGIGTAAQFYNPTDVIIDASGNLFVADYENNRIRKVAPDGTVTTFAGSTQGYADGIGTAALFNHPCAITADVSGNLYVVDRYNQRIRKISPAGVVTTIAGNGTVGFADGPASSAMFNYPVDLDIDASGNIYVSDCSNYRIRRISPAGVVSTLAGTGAAGGNNGVGSTVTFGGTYAAPSGIAFDGSGSLYETDYGSNLIRKTVTTPYTISPNLPTGLSFDPNTGIISGTPTVKTDSATTYTITAYNMTGIGTTTLTIGVNPGGPPAPSADQNYVLTNTPRISGFVNDSTLMAAASDKTQVQTGIQYMDGLGRPVQTVHVYGSPMGYDMVQPQSYDQYGREVTKYLPYMPQGNAGGSFKTNALTTAQAAFYTTPPIGVSVITAPYAQTTFDNSPLDRPVEQGAPGVPWQLTGVSGGGHTVKMVYTVNNDTTFATDSVNSRQTAMYYCTINSNLSRTLQNNGYYTANTLTVTVSKDENWVNGRAGTVEEYKDIDGQVVLKRVYNYNGTTLQQLSTYYVYDDLGKLAFVLPPASGADGAGTISQVTLDNLCYQYQYDELGRPIAKKIPGKGWEFTVYNVMDQPVASQDSLQRANKNWIFTKYDALGRPILTGIWNNGNTAISRVSMQTTLSGISTNLFEAPVNSGNGYTNVAWPMTNVTATLTTDYYDTYANIPGLPPTYTLSSGVSPRTRGLPTAKKMAVLNTPTDQLWDVIYYDDLGRTTKTYAQHYLGGTANANNYDLITTTYNFTNQPTTVTRAHWNTTSTVSPLVTISNTYSYDHTGRKLKTWEQITNGSSSPTTKTLISKIDYNEIGQVLNKHLHSTDSITFMQNIAYAYNERGWLTSSTAPMFTMQLQYNTGTNKAYNGNIMYQTWLTPGYISHNYAYTYDKLNRLLSGVSDSLHKENNIAYDLMGNITQLSRYRAGALIDSLAYTYTSGSNATNQLQVITDASTNNLGLKPGTWAYTYDGNGNLTTDPSKGTGGISIAYNLLNLPQSVTGGKTITYTYDATGNKLRRVSSQTGNTDYINGIQYDGATTPALSFIQTEEGKAVPNGSAYTYTYYLGDNLGNTRITFDIETGVAKIIQRDDYFPFGMEISNVAPGIKNEYLYNKKELQEELEEYDYGARFYDPVIARWNTIDPLAEINRRWSPYNYVLDNPIRFEDPDGMDWKDPNDKKIADRLQGEIASRLKTENGNLKSANDRVAKLEGKIAKDGSSKGLESRLASAKSDVASIGTTISDLNKSSSELTQMETTTKQTFAFNELPAGSEVGGTEKGKDGVITMGITGDANAIHEATHGFQIFSTGGITQAGRFDAEVSAYQRQYSFDSNSVTAHAPSDWGSIGGRTDITPNWVMGLHDNNSNYIYMPGFKPKDIRELFKQIRKTP
jgi:RHS repeat-associated protein